MTISTKPVAPSSEIPCNDLMKDSEQEKNNVKHIVS